MDPPNNTPEEDGVGEIGGGGEAGRALSLLFAKLQREDKTIRKR